MSIFRKYKEYIIPASVGIFTVIVLLLILSSMFPELFDTFVSPIFVGLIASAIWAFLIWIFITRKIDIKEKKVEEAAFKRFHPHISAFIDKIEQNFTFWGKETDEFRKTVKNYIEEHPNRFQDPEKRINRFKAICSDNLLQDFIDIMSRLDNNSWDEIIQATKQLKEDLFTLHIYLPHISLEYTETIINHTTKLEYFVRRIELIYGQWKSSSIRKNEKKPFFESIKSFHKLLKIVDEFMTSIRHYLKLDIEETI